MIKPISHKVLVIAEAGVNHDGDLTKALQLIDAAADSGADVVKFQTFKAQQLVTTDAELASIRKESALIRLASQTAIANSGC